MRATVLLCALLWSLVDSQPPAPYVSFNDMNLPNHGYVNLNAVGDPLSGGVAVQCHTDIQECCSSAEGGIRTGDWYFPDGDRVPFGRNTAADIHSQRTAQRVDLRRRNDAVSPSGIYRCAIMVDGDDNIREEETVYVGIYGSGGEITIPDDSLAFALMSDNTFTLTCISTGGPATTVTWTRGSQTVVGERRSEVVNRVTAEYTHTLTVTGRLGGLYTCTVTNNIPSGDSVDFTVQDPPRPSNLKAEAGDDLTSILLTWTPSSGANGYIIFYDNGAGSSGTVNITGGSTDNYILTGLLNGTTYNISILATSEHFFSDSVLFDPVELVAQCHTSKPGTDSSSSTMSWAVIGGLVLPVIVVMVIVIVIVIVIVVLVMRKHRVPTGVQKRDDIPIATNEAYHTVSHAKAAEADYEQIDPDVIPTSSNEAYHTVSQTGETTTDYETVSDPHTVPPSTSHSSQPGDYEQV